MGKATKGTSKGIIDRFVRSKRTLLPHNISWYQRDNFKEEFCPFCDEVHSDIMLMYRPTMNSQTIILEGVYVCEECDKALADKTSDDQMEDLFEGFAKRAGEQTVSKIDAFVYEGIFPENTYKHYQHLNPDIEPFKVCSDKCIFCEGYTGGTVITDRPEVYKELPVPMGNESYILDGGIVRICASCNLILSTRLTGGYMNHILEYCGYDLCSDCGNQYIISNLEVDARKSEGTFGHHSCTECTYKRFIDSHSLVANDEDLLGIYKVSRDPESFKINRYITKDCGTCGDEIGLDITYTPAYILRAFISKQGIYSCSECLFMDNSPIEFVLNGDKILRIYNIKGKFYIRVSTRSGKNIHLHTELTAQQVIEHLLGNSTKQLELDL